MYAAYQVDGSARHTMRATTFGADNEFEDTPLDRGSDLTVQIMKYCVVGTFGLLTPMYLSASAATSNWNINQIEIQAAPIQATNGRNSSARDIAHIREVLKISVTELGRVFGVTRQAVHEWIKGGALSPKNAQRLSDLAQAADVLTAEGLEISPPALRRKISNGQSLLDSVAEGGDVVRLAQQLVETLKREARQREGLTKRLAGRKKPELVASDFGAPHLAEDA